MNNITIIGNIGEPTLRMTSTNKAVLTFGLAVNRKVGDDDRTTWFNVKVWGELAENLAATISKGDRVMVCGYVETEEYQDKDGNTKKNTVVVAQDAGVSVRWAARG